MKRVIKSIYIFALTVFIFSCSKDDNITDVNKNLEEATSVQSSVSAKPFVESNEELDVKINLTNPDFMKNLSDTEIAKLKAAVYRFYSTVYVKDSNYYTSLVSAAEINISEDLFKLFQDNLDHMNQNINKLKTKEGKEDKVTVQQVTPEYLDSLLK